MARRRLLAQLGAIAAVLLVALGAANAAYGTDASTQAHTRDEAASDRAGSRDVGIHAGVVKTERSERLLRLRLGLAVIGAGVLAFALRRRRYSLAPVGGGRLGFGAGALGRGPPLLRVR